MLLGDFDFSYSFKFYVMYTRFKKIYNELNFACSLPASKRKLLYISRMLRFAKD